jgi:putative PEP-CTERM system TPR-repeat lipoprotein
VPEIINGRMAPISLMRLTFATVLGVVVLMACRNESAADLIRSAREYHASGDHKAAVIQLKNAVQKQPENGEARLLLGQSSLLAGDAASAEKEFRKAAEFGQPPAVVTPLIAEAMLANGAVDKLVAEFGRTSLDDRRADASLRVTVGLAQMSIGKLDDASASFAAALASDPGSVSARIGQARLAAVQGKLDDAEAAVDRIVADSPGSAAALMLQGELRHARGDRAGALASLEKSVALEPTKLSARLDLISLQIEDGQFDAAAKQISAARALRAGDLRLSYFEALIAFEKKDFVRARELTQQVLKIAPEYVPALVLAGAIDMQENQLKSAETHLQRALTLSPQHAGARKLLVRAYMGSNQPARALDAIQPLLDANAGSDPNTMLLAGEIYLANGDLKQASAFYSAAAQSKPQESAARVRLGQIAMASGDPERGIRELEAVTAIEGAPAQADRALIGGYLRRGESAKALEAARALVKKRPKDPVSYQILGSVHLVLKDAANARVAYSKALELEPTYLPAVAGLARLDLSEKKPDDARRRFEDLVAKDPKSVDALLGLAEVQATTKAPAAEIAATLRRAIDVNPQAAVPRLALINLYLREKDTRAALIAAQEADAAVRDDARILDALGRAQLAAGDVNQAIETYNRMATAMPKSTQPLTQLASIYLSRNEAGRAVEVLERAQKIAPADPAISRGLAQAYLAAGKPDDALKLAKALQSATPKSAAGYLLEGDVHAASKQLGPAERAYREALRVDPTSPASALKLHGALLAGGKKSEADALARKWLADHPDDAGFRTYLAEQALRAKDLKSAVAQYQMIIAKQPDNVVALNNLAWALGQLGDAKALGYAERALKLAPDSPLVLDTIGVLMTARGETAKGVEYLERAVALAPQRNDIRLNYAKALLKAGRIDSARKELELLQAGADFQGKSEAGELLKQTTDFAKKP